MSWTDTYSRCQGTRFWPSKSGYLVCWSCYPDAWEALEVLGRRVPGGAERVQNWRQTLQARLDKAGRDFKEATSFHGFRRSLKFQARRRTMLCRELLSWRRWTLRRSTTHRRPRRMIEALLTGDRLSFRLTCCLCHQPFSDLSSCWFAFTRPDPYEPTRTGRFVHRRCIAGRFHEVVGSSQGTLIHAPVLFQQVLSVCPPPPRDECRPTHHHSLLHACRAYGPVKIQRR